MGGSAQPLRPHYIAVSRAILAVGDGLKTSAIYSRTALFPGAEIAPQTCKSNAGLDFMGRKEVKPQATRIGAEANGVTLGALLSTVASRRRPIKLESSRNIVHSLLCLPPKGGNALVGVETAATGSVAGGDNDWETG